MLEYPVHFTPLLENILDIYDLIVNVCHPFLTVRRNKIINLAIACAVYMLWINISFEKLGLKTIMAIKCQPIVSGQLC